VASASIEYSDEEGSRQAAGGEPPSDSNFTQSCRAWLWALSDRFFCFPSGSTSRANQWHYRRQREYPQPPPPTKSSTKITINKVSIGSPLFRLSILNSVRALFVPDLPTRGKGCVSDSFLRLSEGNKETTRYKRRNSRPKGRIRFRKAPLEPTNSLTDAIVRELRSSVSIQTTKLGGRIL
jgi:hypothetical protein